ncbi:eukaryotic translation initiation factor 2 alpha kinase 1 [Pitangus sulphuratus]|nr:eukaryotic translation initiation factor 2 alpha kinase 1 [Pitangus sulphuratus]
MWRGGRAAALRAPPAIEFPEESPEPRFDVLRQAFTRTGLLSPFAFCDEFSTVRLQHNRAITELMKAANQQILNGELDNREPHAIGEKEVHFEAQTSRYLNEFDEVARLGKGGYGKVYKVRNKLDGQFYAIKKIQIKKATRRDCMKSVESGSSIIFADLTSQEEKSCDSTSLRNLGSESVQNTGERNDFTHSNSEECVKPKKCEFSIELPEDSVNNVSSMSTDGKNHSTRGPHSSGDPDASTEGPYQLVDVPWTMKIFQELVEGVCYIHSMGVMHRDIKPRNIFLHGSDHQVKIGDFGLACKDLLWDDADQWSQTERVNGLAHTSGVGTCLYASPEQLQGSRYDFKSDMYSMGVILLELFQPFGTEMERTVVLTHLRTGQIPQTFSKQWPTQAKYVKLLTSESSTDRPTAAQLRDSELFHTPEHVISNLQQKVRQQEEEIEKLRERIRLLSEEHDENVRLGSPV